MGTCDICGATGPVELVKVDGANMYACPRCSKFGEKVKQTPNRGTRRNTTPKMATKKAPPKQFSAPRRIRKQKRVVENYGTKIRTARQAMNLTRKELGAQIFEKETLIARLETEKIVPTMKVVEKLEQKLKIELLEEEEEPISGAGQQELEFSGKGATLGSIARIKRRKKE